MKTRTCMRCPLADPHILLSAQTQTSFALKPFLSSWFTAQFPCVYNPDKYPPNWWAPSVWQVSHTLLSDDGRLYLFMLVYATLTSMYATMLMLHLLMWSDHVKCISCLGPGDSSSINLNPPHCWVTVGLSCTSLFSVLWYLSKGKFNTKENSFIKKIKRWSWIRHSLCGVQQIKLLTKTSPEWGLKSSVLIKRDWLPTCQ